MKTNMSAANDPIYIALFEAREDLVKGFSETMKNLSTVQNTNGERRFLEEKLQEEHDRIIAELDLRINRRIMELAVEELS